VAVVRVAEVVWATEAGGPARQTAAETDQVQAAAVCCEVAARQDAYDRRRRERPHCRH